MFTDKELLMDRTVPRTLAKRELGAIKLANNISETGRKITPSSRGRLKNLLNAYERTSPKINYIGTSEEKFKKLNKELEDRIKQREDNIKELSKEIKQLRVEKKLLLQEFNGNKKRASIG